MKLLVTGGAGYIGIHTCLCLLRNDYDVVILDNLQNSTHKLLERVQRTATSGKLVFVEGDIRDSSLLDAVFQKYKYVLLEYCDLS